MAKWLSPDCRDGNPTKCDGVAWNTIDDEPTDCEGEEHGGEDTR